MTSVTLRPNGTVTGGGATFTGGTGTWHGNTSDDSDASYATLPAGGIATLNLGTTTLNTGALLKTLRVRMRVRSDSGTTAPSVFAMVGGSQTAFVQASISTTITTYTGSALALTLTQAQIDALQLQVRSNMLGAVRFVELYADLVISEIPTVTVLTPTGTITTSTADVTWTYTQGSDGGPQSRYWVKVFSSATIAGGGFNPETSTALYDSGEVASSAVGHVTGSLPNGTNHGVYVKAAQTVNGVSQWSAWASSTFTVSVATPDVSTMTFTPGASSILVTVNRNTGLPAWNAVTVQRSDDLGVTWKFVRGATSAAASGNTFTVTDYEALHSSTVLYQARAEDLTTPLIGPWFVSGSLPKWTSSFAWLKSISNPTLNRTVTLKEAFAWETEVRTGVFQVLGRSAPVVVADTVSSRHGPLVLQTATRAEADGLLTMLRSGGVMFLQVPDAWDIAQCYFIVQGYGRAHLAPDVAANGDRIWSVNIIEVDRPPDTNS